MLLILRNYNYGIVGKGIKQDLLNHPELLEQNATLAFEAAIWRWMTPMKRKQPSAHDAFAGNWKPTKKDTLSKRYPGFGATMSVLCYIVLLADKSELAQVGFLLSVYNHVCKNFRQNLKGRDKGKMSFDNYWILRRSWIVRLL